MQNEKLIVAVVAGGFTDESVISLKSAEMVMDHIDRDRFDPTLVYITKKGWSARVEGKEFSIDKSNFSVQHSPPIYFDMAFIMAHGTPGEDGTLQGYFDMIDMPYTTGDVHNMSLTFDKAVCNNYLNTRGFDTAKNLVIKSYDHYSTAAIVGALGLPVFVKPNRGGSSLCTTKVGEKEALHHAIDQALTVDSEVIIEQFMDGTEVTCGLIELKGKLIALPLTEIVSHTEFFDYEAKYQGKSDEITPARIEEQMTLKVQELSKEIYILLRCRGMARIDYIIENDIPLLIEVNTVPGYTPESLIPQQLEKAGIPQREFISGIIDAAIRRYNLSQATGILRNE